MPCPTISAWWWRFALGVAGLVAPVEAGATPTEAGTFGYRAPPECPTRADFSAQVAARTKSWLAPSAPFAVTVVIDREPRGLVGRVTFTHAEQRTLRELQAAGCGELAQALALIVAILIDPQASAAPLPPARERWPPPVFLLLAPVPAPRLPPPTLWFVAGPEVVLDTSLTRDTTFGERLFVGLGRGDRSLAASSARLSFARVAGDALSPSSGSRAEFVLETARLEGCLLRVADGGLAVEPCPFVELGRLRAVGIHSAGNVTRHELWGALGLSLRPTWTFSRRLVLGGGLGLALPFRQYRFAFTGEPELTRTAALGFEASLGLGLRFP